MHGRGGDMCGRGWECVWQRGACIAGEMATAADGTHPTGMYSCFIGFLPPANAVWGKVIFLHLSVILFTGGSTCAGTPLAGTPQAGTPPRRYTPRAGTSPLGRYPPRTSACWEIRATSVRYASYWNAFLFRKFLKYVGIDAPHSDEF